MLELLDFLDEESSDDSVSDLSGSLGSSVGSGHGSLSSRESFVGSGSHSGDTSDSMATFGLRSLALLGGVLDEESGSYRQIVSEK